MSGKKRQMNGRPIPEEVLKIAQENIPAQKAEGIKELGRGAHIRAFKVITDKGEELVIRIPHGEKGGRTQPRFAAEAWALAEAKKVGVPVPEVLAFDEDSDPPFMIETKIPGASLDELYPQLSTQEQDSALAQLGQCLGKIHSVKTEGFGEIDGEGHGEFPTWPNFLSAAIERNTNYLIKHRLLNPSDKARIADYLEKNRDLFSEVEPRLLHGDPHPEEFFWKDGKVTGIIDFGNCKSGDPLYDIAYLEMSIEGIGKTSKKEGEAKIVLEKIYRSYGNEKLFKERLIFYKTIVACGRAAWNHITKQPRTEKVMELLHEYIDTLPQPDRA